VDREIAVAEARLADLPLVPGCRSQQLLIGDGNVLSTRQKFAGSVRGFNWVTWGASMSRWKSITIQDSFGDALGRQVEHKLCPDVATCLYCQGLNLFSATSHISSARRRR
jgi:hypothetical protein